MAFKRWLNYPDKVFFFPPTSSQVTNTGGRTVEIRLNSDTHPENIPALCRTSAAYCAVKTPVTHLLYLLYTCCTCCLWSVEVSAASHHSVRHCEWSLMIESCRGFSDSRWASHSVLFSLMNTKQTKTQMRSDWNSPAEKKLPNCKQADWTSYYIERQHISESE